MHRSLHLLAAAALILVAPPTFVHAQTPGFGGEERTDSLTYEGIEANARTDPANHTMNRHPSIPQWGGCVPSSIRTAALHAGIDRDKIDDFWAIAQRRVGVSGTYPELLNEMMIEAFGRDEPWISYLGTDPEEVQRVYDELSAEGFLISSTMAWGELYGRQRIAHMVCDPHFSSADGVACVEDNNDPAGIYRWMPSRERLARAMGDGQAWLVAFTRKPKLEQAKEAAIVLLAAAAAAAVLIMASSLLLLGWRVTSEPASAH